MEQQLVVRIDLISNGLVKESYWEVIETCSRNSRYTPTEQLLESILDAIRELK